MELTTRKFLQERAAMILTAALVVPISIFLVTGYLLLSTIAKQKDVTTLNSLAQNVRFLESKRTSQSIQMQAAITDTLYAFFDEKPDSRIISFLTRENPDLDSYVLFTEDHVVGSGIQLSKEQREKLIEISAEKKEGSGYYLGSGKRYIMTYSVINAESTNPTILVLYWNYTLPENLYINTLKDFHTMRIDWDRIKTAPQDKYETERRLIDNINATSEGIFIEELPGNLLSAHFFLHDVFGKPIAIVTMQTERYFVLQMKRLFWIGGLSLSFLSIVSALLLARKAASYLMNPVEKLSYQMNQIASNPVHSEEINQGEFSQLDLLVSSFNGILRSFKEYYGSVQKYESIVTNIKEGIFWSDDKGYMVISNKAFDDIFKNQGPIGNLSEIWGGGKDDFKQRIAGFEDGNEIEIDGRYYLLFVNEYRQNGKANYLGLISEITQQKEAEIERQRLEMQLQTTKKLAEIGLLIEGISHNLNSPLHNMLAYVHFLRGEFGDHKDLIKLQENGQRMAEIIKSLMNRMSEAVVFSARPIDINELVGLELAFFEHNLYFKNNVRKVIRLQENLPDVMAVYSDISQALSNLISNAVDAVKGTRDKTITIETFLRDENLVISVEDTGVGIPEERLGSIFEPFQSSKETANGIGRGIGLAISRQLLESYDAKVNVESVVNQGSRFEIVFPKERFVDE